MIYIFRDDILKHHKEGRTLTYRKAKFRPRTAEVLNLNKNLIVLLLSSIREISVNTISVSRKAVKYF